MPILLTEYLHQPGPRTYHLSSGTGFPFLDVLFNTIPPYEPSDYHHLSSLNCYLKILVLRPYDARPVQWGDILTVDIWATTAVTFRVYNQLRFRSLSIECRFSKFQSLIRNMGWRSSAASQCIMIPVSAVRCHLELNININVGSGYLIHRFYT